MRATRAKVGRWIAILMGGLALAFPLIYLIAGSLMTRAELSAYPPPLLPVSPQWGNFAEALALLDARSIPNTFIFVLGVLGLQLVLCLPAGFALAKIRFRGSRVILGSLLVPVFLPANLMLVPTFVVVYQLGLVGTWGGLILPVAAGVSVGILLFRQFFATLPEGLLEAARLDGAGWFRTFFSIALPLARPAIAAYSVVTFLAAWNMYVWPLIAGNKDTRVLTVALAPLAQNQYTLISPAVTFAAGAISIIPVLIVFIVFQRWFTRGVVGSGLE